MSVIELIRRQLRRYKDLLSNLSRRNRELYFREARGSTLNLTKKPPVEPDFQDLLEERFAPLRTSSPSLSEAIEKGSLNISDHFLLKDINNPELQKRLDKIRLADDKFQREFGISGAWLLGPFLLWREAPNYKLEELLVTPIFKLPIDLRKDRQKHWHLDIEDPQLQINPSLRIALKVRWGIEVPETIVADNFASALEIFKETLNASGKQIQLCGPEVQSIPKIPPRYKLIKDEAGEVLERQPVKLEEVLSPEDLALYKLTTHQVFQVIDAYYIDQLNASRTVLISDYDTILESNDLHPILSELFLGKPIPGERGADREKIRHLDSYKERDNYFVVNIDSTQHRAIDKASNNRAVVIQGPPGTGKSQTITNLIAENLAKGKKVLFVSEKRPALDVVFSRLQQANLESQAVLIHSSDLNKQDLYKSFLELSDVVHNKSTDKEWDRATIELDNVKSELNNYYDILAQTHRPSDLTVADLLTAAAETDSAKPNTQLYAILKHLTYSELCSASSLLDELQRLVRLVPNYENHPWRTRRPGTIFSELFSHTFKDLVENITAAETKYLQLQEELLNITGQSEIDNLPTPDEIAQHSQLEIKANWLAPAKAFLQDGTSALRLEQSLSGPRKTISDKFDIYAAINPDADLELVRQLELYYTLKRGFVDWFTPSFWHMRRMRLSICPNWDGTNKAFKAFREMREAITAAQQILSSFLLPASVSIDLPKQTDLEIKDSLAMVRSITELGTFLRKIGWSYFQQFSDLSEDTPQRLRASLNCIQMLQAQILQQQSFLDQLYARLDTYFLDTLTINRYQSNSATYQQLLQTMSDLDALDRVDLHLDRIKPSLIKDDVKQLLELLLPIQTSWSIYSRSLVVRGWIDETRAQFPILRAFDSKIFTEKVSKFQILERNHRECARNTVNNMLFKRWNGGQGEHEGLALLTKEANKQRRVLSPREIMEKGALSAMMKLKPCWLMSPLSISQMLPMQPGLFDMIIFDEASQVRVEDAVPSIYRSNSMVVVGDPKQMPPTNFFSGSEIPEDEEDETEFAASILDLAAQVYPAEMLEWHYRSRSEALIAFSNRAFYGGRLIAVPSPHFITEGDSLNFHRVNEGYFNQKDGNIKEAEAVTEYAYQILKTSPSISLGIIAMGQGQMLAIEKTIEQRSTSDSVFRNTIEAARSFKDGDSDAGFFVKNLENVQGDERDIILISVGYAPANKDKKLRLGFGPLSNPGGGRRLNVAITRAKQQVHVFCSFDPNEIPTDEAAFSKNPDTVFFGRYLKFVKATSEKRTGEALAILDSFGVGGAITTRKGSNFSRDVQRRLTDLGYQVSAEIGSSGFYIDLAIHHPVIQSNFVLGIECDGALFHSTPYARDRDKIRMELLKSRGWRIERIWSQDWSKNWEMEISRIDSILKKLLGIEQIASAKKDQVSA